MKRVARFSRLKGFDGGLPDDDYFGPRANAKESPEIDFYHWSAVLRSVSGFEVYRKVYRDVIKPERVAELLILKPDMPRSLHASLNAVVTNLALVANSTTQYTATLTADTEGPPPPQAVNTNAAMRAATTPERWNMGSPEGWRDVDFFRTTVRKIPCYVHRWGYVTRVCPVTRP